MRKAILVTFGVLLIVGCGSDEFVRSNQTSSSSNSREFTYDYRVDINGTVCDTGKRSFGNRSDYCNALREDARRFETRGCSGQTFNLPQRDFDHNC